MEATDGQRLTFGALVTALGSQGFGPLFTLLAMLVMLPTGAIPGMPALVGALWILLAGQLILGWPNPWLPRRVRDIGIDRHKMRKALDWARPWARRIGRILHPRLDFVATGPIALRLTAVAVALAAMVMIPFGFIPFLPFLLGVPVLAFGLGLSARDGLFTAFGYGILTVVAAGIIYRIV